MTLVVGFYPTEKPRHMVESLRPSLDALERSLEDRLGERVEIRTQVFSDYQTTLERFLAGEVDFARLGAASYVLGKERDPAIELLAMENDQGSVSFEGVIVTREDSDIRALEDLRGRTFAFVSRRSTLGRYFAQAYLARAGVHADDLASYGYLGHHEAVGLAVGSGRYDAGALNRRMFNKLTARGVPLRAIARYRNVTRAWVARAGLAPRISAGLRQALLELKDSNILTALGFQGFLPGQDADFDRTRRVIAENAAFFAGSAEN